jgi:hypothetical protein
MARLEDQLALSAQAGLRQPGPQRARGIPAPEHDCRWRRDPRLLEEQEGGVLVLAAPGACGRIDLHAVCEPRGQLRVPRALVLAPQVEKLAALEGHGLDQIRFAE